MASVTDAGAVVAARLASQLLTGPAARSPEEVVGRILAVQAQDARGFRLTVRSRSSGLLATDVDRALGGTRSLVVAWLNRGTLHLVTAEDYWWLHPLTTPQLRPANERRLREEGVSEANARRGVAVIVDAVTSEGPQTREQLRRRLEQARVPVTGQALGQLLLAASVRHHVVRGPMIGNQHAYVSAPLWLGPGPAAFDRDEGLARLARRYLVGHGPASAQDLAKWAGLTGADAQRGFDAISGEIIPWSDGMVGLRGRTHTTALPPARLLGPFDPLLHGWRSRAPFVGTHAGVVTTNGIFRPVALVRGRVVATWSLADGVVSIVPLEPIAVRAHKALLRDGDAVLRFLGLPHGPRRSASTG
jgi:hypothetical protein